jgi:hypothetical protein
MNKIDGNLHATGGHASTICMRLAVTQLKDKRQADKRCVKGRLYIIINFFSIGKSISSMYASYFSADGPWFVACNAASFLQAGCENKSLNKKMKTPLKNLRIYSTHVLNKCYPSTLCMAQSNLIRRYR